tara:strand:- start:404 stop:577 length:174 start_codon:yes stop_codon:yes gene_type:complete
MWEQYEIDDTDSEIIEAFIDAFIDRDSVAMREVLYMLTDFMEDLYGQEHDPQAEERR